MVVDLYSAVKPEAGRKLNPRLSAASAAWTAGGSAANSKTPNANTIVEAEQAVRYLRDLHGDLRVGEITREKAREFGDAITKVPTGLLRDLRQLPLNRHIERDLSGFKPRRAATANKIVQIPGPRGGSR